MVSFPFCKINLGLHVLSKRDDGYHNIETCFYPVPWTDVLEILPAEKFSFSVSGIPVPGPDTSNSCVTAWRRLASELKIPPVSIHLHKIIPAGGGLGGGSSDGAFALRALNEIFSLNLSAARLGAHAAALGSDCAFFLNEHPMIGTGRGEMLHPCAVRLSGKFLVIVKPEIHVSTADAYRGVVPAVPAVGVAQLLSQPIAAWRGSLVNDFESTVFKKYPHIGARREKLYSLGAVYASMSGSGASVFALFDQPVNAVREFPGDLVWSGVLP